MADSGRDTCSLDGCDNDLKPHQKKYCCRDHYDRDRNGLSVDDDWPTCALDGCSEQLDTGQEKYCCRDHALEDNRKELKECENPECDTKHDNAKYCGYDCHYDDRRRRAGSEQARDTRIECQNPDCDEMHDNEKFCSRPCQYEARRAATRTAEIEDDLMDYTVSRDPETGEPLKYHFVVNGKIFPIPADTWERICELYSEQGANLTQKEVAREVGIGYPVLKRILRDAGQFKASLPFSRERIEQEDEDTLVEEALETKERQIMKKIQSRDRRKRDRELRRLKERYADEQRFVEQGRELMKGVQARPDPLKEAGEGRPVRYIIPVPDAHVGAYGWREEKFGLDMDTDLACGRIRGFTDHSARWIRDEPGRAEVVDLCLLGDYYQGIETDHGTELDVDTREERVWAAGGEAALYAVERYREVAEEIHLRVVPGNHAPGDEYKLAYGLQWAFEEADDVTIHVHPHKFDAFLVGRTQWILDHGYGVGSLEGWKAKAQAEVVAEQTSSPEQVVQWRRTLLGDKHTENVGDLGEHHKLIRLPAFTEPSEYATENRFAGTPEGFVFRLRPDGRRQRVERIKLREVQEAA